MEIQVINQQTKLRLKPLQIKKIAKIILRYENINDVALSFVFVTHQKIRALNKQFLNRDYATDVLAFDSGEYTVSKKKVRRKINKINGDIIISTDAVLKNARNFKSTTREELCLYVIHGILHLCGYDDHGKKNVQSMRAKEIELMTLIKNKKL